MKYFLYTHMYRNMSRPPSHYSNIRFLVQTKFSSVHKYTVTNTCAWCVIPLLFKAFLCQERLLNVVELVREMKHTSHSEWEGTYFEMCLKTENELLSLLNAWFWECEEYRPFAVIATLEVCV
jgi:hypothetical protein